MACSRRHAAACSPETLPGSPPRQPISTTASAIVKRVTERVVLRLLIQTGRGLDELVAADVDELATALHRCAEAKGNRSSWVNDRSLVLAAHRVLFHLGVLDTAPQDPRRRPGLAGHYSGVDEPLRTPVRSTTASRPPPPGHRPPSRRSPATSPDSAAS